MSTQLEDLPNELFYIIFTYLHSIDLYLAFCNLNERFRQLLDAVACHQSLDLTSGHTSYERFRAYIADRYHVRSSFISSLTVDCFNLSPFDIKDLFSCFANTSIPNRLQRLILITNEAGSVTAIDIIQLLEHMMIANKQGHGRLKHLTVNFEFCEDYYYLILIKIIQRNISFDTMILNVSKYIITTVHTRLELNPPNETNLHLAMDTRPSLGNTVHLSLSLEYCWDLVLLLQHGVLPLLQHLNVVFQHRNAHIRAHRVRFQVDESCLRTTDTARLRTLSLSNLHLHYALQFVRFLRLTQLETLRLINIHDRTITRIVNFERAISIRLYNLITLQFVLRLAMKDNSSNNELYSPQDYAILHNDLWRSRGWFVHDYIDNGKKEYIIYTIPYPLSSDCQLRHHTFIAVQQPDLVDLKTYQLLWWTCRTANSSAVAQCLNGLSQARYLYWNYEPMICPSMFILSNNTNSVTRWPSMQLRSLCLLMNLAISLEDRANMITQLLLICPRLHTLVVYSKELALCLERRPTLILSLLDHLHLYLDSVDEIPNPVKLAAVFPNVSYISTGKRYLTININLGHVVLNLIKTLPHLRRLQFNDYSFIFKSDTDQVDDDPVVLMLKNSDEIRSKNSSIKLYKGNHLSIWL